MPQLPVRLVAVTLALVWLAPALVWLAPARASADPAPADLERQIRTASDQLNVVVEEYNGLREELRLTTAQSGVLARQVPPLESRVGELRARIAEVATTAYKTAGVSASNAILAGFGTPDFVRRLDLLDELVRLRQAEIADLHRARDDYLAARRTLDALAGQQRDQERTLAERKARIEADIAALEALRTKAYGDRAGRPAAHDTTVPPLPAGALGEVARFAAGQLGKAYAWAADGPDAYDCSGLVVAAYRAVGVTLPHSSRAQWDAVTHIPRRELRAGDLVFYYGDAHHVGIFVGDGKVIHAPQYGEAVQVAPIDNAPIHGYGRLSAA